MSGWSRQVVGEEEAASSGGDRVARSAAGGRARCARRPAGGCPGAAGRAAAGRRAGRCARAAGATASALARRELAGLVDERARQTAGAAPTRPGPSQAVPPTTSTSFAERGLDRPRCSRATVGRRARRRLVGLPASGRSGPADAGLARRGLGDLVEQVADDLVAVGVTPTCRPSLHEVHDHLGRRCTSCRCPAAPGSASAPAVERRAPSRTRRVERRLAARGPAAVPGRGARAASRRSRSQRREVAAAGRPESGCEPVLARPSAATQRGSAHGLGRTRLDGIERRRAAACSANLDPRLSVTRRPTSSTSSTVRVRVPLPVVAGLRPRCPRRVRGPGSGTRSAGGSLTGLARRSRSPIELEPAERLALVDELLVGQLRPGRRSATRTPCPRAGASRGAGRGASGRARSVGALGRGPAGTSAVSAVDERRRPAARCLVERPPAAAPSRLDGRARDRPSELRLEVARAGPPASRGAARFERTSSRLYPAIRAQDPRPSSPFSASPPSSQVSNATMLEPASLSSTSRSSP